MKSHSIWKCIFLLLLWYCGINLPYRLNTLVWHNYPTEAYFCLTLDSFFFLFPLRGLWFFSSNNTLSPFFRKHLFFWMMHLVFVISTSVWTMKSSFSCEKEISQLFIKCGSFLERVQKLRKICCLSTLCAIKLFFQ